MGRVPEHVHQQGIGAALALVHQVEVAVVDHLQLHRAGHDLDGHVDADRAPLGLDRLPHLLAVEDGPAHAQRGAVLHAGNAVCLADSVAVPIRVPGLLEQPPRGLGVVRVEVRVPFPVARMDRVQGAVGWQIVPVVQQVVDGGLIGSIQHGLPDAEVAEGRTPHVHDHLQPGSGLVAGQQREALRIAVIIDVGGGQIHGDMGVAGADDVAQHRLLADETDGDALDLGRARVVADRVPPAVAVPAPHGHVVVGHPLLQQERPRAHQMAVELLDAPLLRGRGRPDRDPAEGVEDRHPGSLVVEGDGGVVDHLHALDRPDVGRHLPGARRRVEDALDVVPDRLRVERGAVLEHDAALQRERPLVRDVVGRPARGQRRMELPVRPENQQRIGDLVVDEPRGLVRLDVAVERGGLAGGGPGDDEFVGGVAGAGVCVATSQ